MMPHLSWFGATLCERGGELEGWTIRLSWRRWVFELTLARWPRG